MSGRPDPKPTRARKGNRPRRIVDPAAVRGALHRHPECAACEERATNGHHVIQKGSPHFGDDVEGNIVGLCGSGSARCHGAVHGNPYVAYPGSTLGEVRMRRDSIWVRTRIGETIVRDRPDVIAYVIEKLGRDPGSEFLRREYGVEVRV